jgi:predicted PurR-regulated permease PerM
VSQQAARSRPERDHEHVARISTGTTLFLISAGALSLYELQVVLVPFVLAGVVSYICTPAIEWITSRTRLPRLLVAILLFVTFLAFACGVGFLGAPPLVHEMKGIVTDLQGTVGRLTHGLLGDRRVSLLGQQTDAEQLANTITQAIRSAVGNARVVSIAAGSVFVGSFAIFLTLVLLFFFMVSGPRVVHGLLWLIPPGERPLIENHILSKLHPVLRRYFMGVIAVVCYAATFAYVGLGLVLGVPHAVFLSLITGILEAIPIVGPIAAAILVGVIAIQHNFGIRAVVGYAIYLAALRLSIDQLIGPVLLGAAGRVHPTLIIFCFLAGGALFGIVGVIISVPVALVVKTTLSVLYDEPAANSH